jgi:lipoprotein-anchoring transpeptidase ErfK/SrfK
MNITKNHCFILTICWILLACASQVSAENYFDKSLYSPGDIIIKRDIKKLFFVGLDGDFLSYPVAIGKKSTPTPNGVYHIVRKEKWPAWFPTSDMRKKQRNLPARVPGGFSNPLGSRVLYLDKFLIRIHGTNNPRSIGKAASHGCIRMRNSDIESLYQKASVGTSVFIE